MSEKNLYIVPLFLATLLVVLHFIANAHFLYWRLWWYDIMMHFIGGVLIGAVSLWFVRGANFFYSKATVLLFSFSVALTVCVSWEVFEYLIGFTYHHFASYVFDTYKDIVVGVLGAVLFVILATPKNYSVNQKNYG